MNNIILYIAFGQVGIFKIIMLIHSIDKVLCLEYGMKVILVLFCLSEDVRI